MPNFRSFGLSAPEKNNNKPKGPKAVLLKTLERCRSVRSPRWGLVEKQQGRGQQQQLPPEGCFTVYVGPARERFMVRTELINHPLFRMLLDEAELEYGYSTPGPLMLPCNVELFEKVLEDIEQETLDRIMSPRCNFGRRHPPHPSYQLFSPRRPCMAAPMSRVY